MEPDAARRVAVAAGRHRDAEHLGFPADRQFLHGDALRQSAGDDLGGVDRRIADFPEQRQAADVVLVAVAQNHRIDAADAVEVGEAAGRRTFAEIEEEAFALGFEQERGRAFPADAGNEPQRSR